MTEWEERLLTEARKIRQHGWGKLDFQAIVVKDEVRITIIAGKSYQFIIKRIIKD